MFDLERAADMLANVKPVRVETALCTQARSGRSTCRTCVEICPAGAVSLGRGPVVTDACTACGLCAAACRTGALRMETPSDVALLTEARKAQGDPLVVACAAHGPGLRERVVKVPCIGAVTPEVLVGMLAGGHSQILLWRPEACAACGNRAGVERMDLAPLEALYPGAVGFASSLAEVGEGAPGHQAPGDRAGTETTFDQSLANRDRRAFLGSAFKSGGSLLGLLLGDWAPKKPAPPAPTIYEVQGTPRRRQVLRDAMAARPPAPGARLPEFAPLASPACTLCPVCTKLCPSGALHVTESGDHAALQWQASRCTDCGLCREICPVGAMGRGEQLTADRFQAEAPEPLMEGERAICGCGAKYWHTPGGPDRCFACRMRG
ncbi:MAG: 4Fe-4S ferredoxin [Symbiobacteriaceae bacterium]|jgi:ferredoxin|nr:4Fe-4S ferredoxin [Symbiobacteriaceae bacterium]